MRGHSQYRWFLAGLRSLRRGRVWLALLCSGLILASAADAQEGDDEKATKVKVAFLYNFIKYVEWPEGRSPSLTHKATLCVSGNTSFGPALRVLQSSLAGKIDLSIMQDITPAEVGSCNIMFLASASGSGSAQLLSEARKGGVLTVSDAGEFADNGGVIEMSPGKKAVGLFALDRISLRVNVRVAEASGLRISPQLLEIAAEVIK